MSALAGFGRRTQPVGAPVQGPSVQPPLQEEVYQYDGIDWNRRMRIGPDGLPVLRAGYSIGANGNVWGPNGDTGREALTGKNFLLKTPSADPANTFATNTGAQPNAPTQPKLGGPLGAVLGGSGGFNPAQMYKLSYMAALRQHAKTGPRSHGFLGLLGLG